MPLSPGQILQGRYTIQSLLGQGGMGSVYRAFDQTLNRAVAIKERTPDPNATPQGLAQTRAQFQREAQVLANLHHDNLPRVTDYFSFGGNEYLVMDLIEGMGLDQVVRQHGAIGEGAVRAWMNQILDALIYIHSHQPSIIHRDIKPANIILKPDGKVALVDFGLVKLLDPNNPGTLSSMRAMGTPEYAPIEQFSPGMHTDARSDLYSLGATMYHLLSGRAPLDVPRRLVDPTQMPNLRALNPSISKRTEAVVQKAMEIQPQNRFVNAAEMKQQLAATAPTRAPAPTVTPPAYTPPAPVAPTVPVNPLPLDRFKALAVALAGLVVVCALGVGLLFLTGVLPPKPAPTGVAAVAPTSASATRVLTPVPTQTPFVATATPLVTLIPTPTFPLTRLVTLIPTPTFPLPVTFPMTPLVSPTPHPVETRIFADSAPMVFVPAGDFTMGNNDGRDDEKPPHTVYLDAFWIDKFEVTNALYRKCVDAGKCSAPSDKSSSTRSSYYGNSSFGNYPVIYVSWNDANTYCGWVGKRLPTEAEWEKAARGTEGPMHQWGQSLGFTESRFNSGVLIGDTKEVGEYPDGASPYGALDMVGNAWEWVADWYDANYYANSPQNNPKGPSSGQNRVLRGGSLVLIQGFVRYVHRFNYSPIISNYYVGFRCAQ